jgi:hypothetical protein
MPNASQRIARFKVYLAAAAAAYAAPTTFRLDYCC